MGKIKTARQLLDIIETYASQNPVVQDRDMFSSEFERFAYYAKTNNDYWDVNPDRTPVGSGGLKTLLKRSVRKTTGWYTRPAFDEQRQFNASVTRAFNELVNILQVSQTRIAELESQLGAGIDNIVRRLDRFEQKQNNQQESLQVLQQDAGRIMGRLGLQDAETEQLADSLYVEFENTFRGSSDSVRDKHMVYLPFLNECRPLQQGGMLLDLGCGRGEWMQLLKDNGLVARGCDMNAEMVAICQDKGLDAQHLDAISALKQLPEGSLAGVSAFHVAEHISFETLVLLLNEAMRTLVPGGIIILETPNPENLSVSGYSFYLDPSHRNPIPPESLEFFLGKLGFLNTQILRIVRRADRVHSGNLELDQLLERFNMEQDFAVIAWRPEGGRKA